MAKINIPADLLQKQALKSLPAKEKEEYMNNILKKILELNPEGVTTSQLKEAIGLTPSTIWHHLEILKSSAQCRKISHGNTDTYYSYGKEVQLKDIDKGKARYTICTVENDEGKFVCIYDKRKNRLDSYSIVRGVDIPFELLDEFIETLGKIKKPVKDKLLNKAFE